VILFAEKKRNVNSNSDGLGIVKVAGRVSLLILPNVDWTSRPLGESIRDSSVYPVQNVPDH
jgi:hypothetical protein